MPPDPLLIAKNRLKSDYPRPDINQEWLSACIRALQESDPMATVPTLIHAAETQLLLSDLSTSCLGNETGLPAPDHDGAYPLETTYFGPAKKDSCLVMITSIMEIGTSAFQLSNVKQQRAEALSGAAKIRRLRIGDGANGENGNEGNEEEEDLAEGDISPYPRGMLMLEVSDGHRYMKAMEYKRISGLQLGETALGSKLLLRNVRALRGILLLTPENTTIKGHMVEEMEDLQGHYFENGLRMRMGKQSLELPDENLAEGVIEADGNAIPDPPVLARGKSPAPLVRARPIARNGMYLNMAQDGGATQFMASDEEDEEDYGMDIEDDVLAEAMLPGTSASHAARSEGQPGHPAATARNSRSRRQSARHNEVTDPFDFSDPDEAELEAAMALEGARASGSGSRQSQMASNLAPGLGGGGDQLEADDDNGMDWAVLAEIDEEERRAARFPGYQQAEAASGRKKTTLPARLKTVLPSRGNARAPVPEETGSIPRGRAKHLRSDDEEAPGETSRFFPPETTGFAAKGSGTVKPADKTPAATRTGAATGAKARREAAVRGWVDVESDDQAGVPDAGETPRSSKPKGKTKSGGTSAVVISDDDGLDEEMLDDSEKENKDTPYHRTSATGRTALSASAKNDKKGVKGRSGATGARASTVVIELLEDSD